jgi:membrane fusion protein (multidrug efflux system)
VPFETMGDALLVPERSLGADQAGRYVLVVGKDEVVERRAVEVGTGVGDLRVVEGKIGPDDLIVVEGLQRARPGLKVNPKPVAADAPKPAPAVASATPPEGATAGASAATTTKD